MKSGWIIAKCVWDETTKPAWSKPKKYKSQEYWKHSKPWIKPNCQQLPCKCLFPSICEERSHPPTQDARTFYEQCNIEAWLLQHRPAFTRHRSARMCTALIKYRLAVDNEEKTYTKSRLDSIPGHHSTQGPRHAQRWQCSTPTAMRVGA